MSTPLKSSVLRRRVILALVGALALPAALPLGTATASHFSNTEELSATDSVGAAIAYSVSTFPEGAEEAVLGRDDAFADSLASGMLQATRPLLLTSSAALSDPTKAELARLAVTTVHVLGGEQAITPAVVTALEAEGYTVQRHSGPTRIDTAVEVAKKLAPAATKAIIARAFGTEEDETRAFADSLAAGGWAAAAGMPVLLTETEKLSEATGAYLKTSAIKEVFVVGGPGAINETVVTQLTALGITVKRVSGPTRFHTALAIASERGFATAGDAEKVIVTEGQAADAWAPGFAAAARSKKDNAPIVLAVGTEIPEPTMTFLTGQAPGEEPTEEPTEEPSPDPSETPTGDPTPDPSESPSEEPAPEGIASLLCAPMLATEACDAAATALGQVAGAGPQHVVFDVAAVGRYDHAVGKIAEPKSVNELTVTGCGYTNEPIYFEPADGTFYLMLAGDPGTCSAEFTLSKSAGPQKQTVEFTVGEDFSPPSSMIIPELVAVRPVKADEEGVHLRFAFDEPIAPGSAINPGMFHLYNYKGKPNSTQQPLSSPSFVAQDPRNPRAVIAIFAARHFEDSTVAAVTGGALCKAKNTSTNTNEPCTTDETATNGDFVQFGAVRDSDRMPNPTAHFPLRTIDRSESSSLAPDLLSVGDYQAADSSLLFTFSEAVAPPTTPDKAVVGAATVLLQDGSIKSSDANGWRQGPTPDSLRVTFAGDQLSAADMEQARRAFVTYKTVLGTVDDEFDDNTPVAAIITGGGISVLPDFVNFESPQYGSNAKVTFVFEEELDKVESLVDTAANEKRAKFVAVMTNGKVIYSKASGTVTAPSLDDKNKKKVTVPFSASELTEAPRYFGVLTGAVRSFATQKWNFADTIKLSNPIIHLAGRTLAPDLTGVKLSFKDGTCPNNLPGDKARFELSFTFDDDITMTSTSPTASGAKAFHIWYHPGDATPDLKKPRVRRVQKVDTALVSTDNTVDERFWASGKSAVYLKERNANASGEVCLTPPKGRDQAPKDTTVGYHWANAKYLSVEPEKVTKSTLFNYPAGMPIPN